MFQHMHTHTIYMHTCIFIVLQNGFSDSLIRRNLRDRLVSPPNTEQYEDDRLTQSRGKLWERELFVDWSFLNLKTRKPSFLSSYDSPGVRESQNHPTRSFTQRQSASRLWRATLQSSQVNRSARGWGYYLQDT